MVRLCSTATTKCDHRHRDSGNCRDLWYNPTYVNWAYGGVETGSLTQPWNTMFEVLDACLVGGTLIVTGGNYLPNTNISKAKNSFTAGGPVRMESNWCDSGTA